MTKKNLLIEIIGWYGTVAIVGSYALNSFNVLSSNSLPYQILNATGAIAIIVISLKKGVYQSVVLNVVWTVIALIAIGKLFI